jgi:hypothetical protein
MRPVVSYRIAPRTIGYAIAAVAAFSIISGAVGGLEASRTAGGDLLFVALIAVGVGAPGALVAWNRGVEVRVYDAGIMSIGPGTAQLIRWRDIARFEVDRYRSTPFAVYAVLGDGSTVALEPLRGGTAHRERIEEVRRALESRLAEERSGQADDAQGGAAWPRVPLGWRHRARHVQARAE